MTLLSNLQSSLKWEVETLSFFQNYPRDSEAYESFEIQANPHGRMETHRTGFMSLNSIQLQSSILTPWVWFYSRPMLSIALASFPFRARLSLYQWFKQFVCFLLFLKFAVHWNHLEMSLYWDQLGHLSMVSDSWFGLRLTVCLGHLFHNTGD